jgi:hypothetical protein
VTARRGRRRPGRQFGCDSDTTAPGNPYRERVNIFACQHCGQLLDFENTRCEPCGHVLGYLPEQMTLSA